MAMAWRAPKLKNSARKPPDIIIQRTAYWPFTKLQINPGIFIDLNFLITQECISLGGPIYFEYTLGRELRPINSAVFIEL